jgi:hypothetical protein
VSQIIRVFVDERPVCIAPGATVLDAVAAQSHQAAQNLKSGKGHVTDGVVRALNLRSPVEAGMIVRTIGRATPPQNHG